ncbi:molecular chaperone DnaJ [Pseudomonas viridiflava]|uniref:molecular chaperone DnaJ n=1 Tax=Pseudomonas viridiflava TaxID=33069 RepID=UPI002EB71A45|nr:molecular chaperone DnaJ [Pseudomonas viridiflava]MEE3931665.1 molecular chaperone DnaJ [Pseudomonas viridiflava]MEE3942432.1 molecular chaperone DnaJ [Pseudomonas viridiflava]MEE3968386.1 molecular chaperone DnaJ [Pseudomonas viridiflava]MEE3982601.1 molecular chaperone DnaJ [Pseudomonas viridiflava]
MTAPFSSPRVVAQPSRPQLSKEQKKFNALMEKLETKRTLLQQWLEVWTTSEQIWNAELFPLFIQQEENDLDRLRLLDQAHDQFRLSKKDRATLQEIIFELITGLMAQGREEELKQLYFKYTGNDYDDDEREAAEMLRASLEEKLGVDLGDDVDLNSPEDVIHLFGEHLKAEDEAAQVNREPKKPSASDIRREQEQAESSQSVREIYRKLASALHPDREQDATERDRKTALMQRVNDAYARNDLLALLQMQMEIEQIDQEHIDNISEKRLKHFNLILRDQLTELEDEIHDRKMMIRERFLMEPDTDIRPKTVIAKCTKRVDVVRDHVGHLRDELTLLTEPKSLKAWLKLQRDLAADYDDFDEFMDLNEPDPFRDLYR